MPDLLAVGAQGFQLRITLRAAHYVADDFVGLCSPVPLGSKNRKPA